MPDIGNLLGLMIPNWMIWEWRRLLPLLPPSVRQWLEEKARELRVSTLPYPQQRVQIERDIRQRFGTLDAGLSVEDKIALMLMLIMRNMDREIEDQARRVQSLQATGARKPAPAARQDASPSIDVETMKLKRVIDKRSQMFDTLRQIIDRHNDTAKNVIQTVPR